MNTIGYNFGDTFIKTKDIEIGVRLSTLDNVYCPLPEETKILVNGNNINIISKKLACAGGQIISEGSIELNILQKESGRIVVTANASHPIEKCKSIIILIKGIEIKCFISESKNMDKSKFSKKSGISPLIYPGRYATMPLIFVEANEKEWYILSKDNKIRRKAFAAYYDYIAKLPILCITHEEDRRYISNSINLPEWHIGKCTSRLEIVKERCVDLEKNFNLVPFSKQESCAWLEDIKLVANFHGMHWTGYAFNTFKDMSEELKWICKYIDGRNVLAFIAAWDGRYYYTYPEHKPSEIMGGEVELKNFINEAHKLKVKVVLMLGGPNLATFKFLKEHNLKDAAMKDENGYPLMQNWVDWNCDLSKESMGLIVNFGHIGFRKYMIETACNLFKEFDIDGIFLDGAIRWENCPDYSPYEGIVEWVKEMKTKYPDKLLMAEDGYDALWGQFDLFATSWQPLGLENALLRYARQTYYLAYPAENGSGGVHEQAWYSDGGKRALKEYTIPTISMISGIIENYEDRLKSKINMYNKWEISNSEIMQQDLGTN